MSAPPRVSISFAVRNGNALRPKMPQGASFRIKPCPRGGPRGFLTRTDRMASVPPPGGPVPNPRRIFYCPLLDPMRSYLDFERPVAELEAKVEELRKLGQDGTVAIADDIARLEAKAAAALKDLYAARRGPPLWRGRSGRRRLRTLPGRAGLRDRPGEGPLDRDAHPPQLRHGSARGLPQGGPPH